MWRRTHKIGKNKIADCRGKYSFVCGNTVPLRGLDVHIVADVVANDFALSHDRASPHQHILGFLFLERG
jgi:hypothetical protein